MTSNFGRRPAYFRGRSRKPGFTLVELLVVITIIGVLIALLLPAVQAAREAARRTQCCNNLKQIGLALHNYAQARGVLPPGCIVSTLYTASDPNDFNPWAEAGPSPSPPPPNGPHGTSWMLMILPYMELQNLYDNWNFQTNVYGNAAVAQTDIAGFYCPTRRNTIRPEDRAPGGTPRMIVSTWNGGTDYGGCLGSGNGWNNTVIDHHFATSTYQPEIWFNSNLIGVFRPNISTAFRDIKDGTSNTIMTGELQRLDGSVMQRSSQDGWALGGVATLFDTAIAENGGTYETGGMNNDFFEAPGSDHAGGAHFGLADGSVRFLSENISKQLFYYLGSMNDGYAAQPPD